jgi:hypothetical protein
MIADAALQADLQQALIAMEQLPLLNLLEQQGALVPLVRQLLLARLRDGVLCGPAQITSIAREICAEFAIDPPDDPARDWPQALPQAVAPKAARRWNQRLLALAIETRYGERLEAHYLNRRAELDQVVFRMMRLEQLGLAEEIYLRLIDDDASFGDLAEIHACGEERHTRGLVGPMPLGQPHPRIRAALAALREGEIAPPFQVERTILLVRLEKLLPAQLTPAIREQLLGELLEAELEASVGPVVEELRRSSLAARVPSDRCIASPAQQLISIGGAA